MRGFFSRLETENNVSIGFGADLVNLHIHLFTAIAHPLSPLTVLADFTEATFDGYADKVIGPRVGPFVNPAGEAAVAYPLLSWLMTGDTMPNVVQGFYIVSTGGLFIAGAKFDQPVNMVDTTSALNLVLQAVLPLTAPAVRGEPLS